MHENYVTFCLNFPVRDTEIMGQSSASMQLIGIIPVGDREVAAWVILPNGIRDCHFALLTGIK